MAKRQQRSRLTTQRILAWADAHFRRTGKWPTYRSGKVFDAPKEDWSAIDGCLEYGGLGLPGGSSLAYVLARHRGLVKGKERPKLSIKLILVWADRHHIRTREWPSASSGPIKGIRGETWRKIDRALYGGYRGLPGGSSLARLLAKRLGRKSQPRGQDLTIKKILKWADRHHIRTRRWPTRRSGPVTGIRGESWRMVNDALYRGHRGLPGGSSLGQLLAKHRGKALKSQRLKLSIKLILLWADRHQIRTRKWPAASSGPIKGIPGETWSGVDSALCGGHRGLPGGSSLAQLLAKHRGKKLRPRGQNLTIDKILKWADRHRARTGRWPAGALLTVEGVPGESWQAINNALMYGYRGLSGGSSLSKLIGERRSDPLNRPLPRESAATILAWADQHRKRTGKWPNTNTGPVKGVPHATWRNVDESLHLGLVRGAGSNTLLSFLAKHRGKPVPPPPTKLTVPQILKWADEHRAQTGRWPSSCSPSIKAHRHHSSWKIISAALRAGCRGLHAEGSLPQLLAKHRDKTLRFRGPDLTIERILAWADHHHALTDRWPTEDAGSVKNAPGEVWKLISQALRLGNRGLPGGSSLAKLLEERRGIPNPRNRPRLTVAKILAWADEHRRRTGDWPMAESGPVQAAPAESWLGVNTALTCAGRGLPGGDSLARLLAKRRGKKLRAPSTALTIDRILAWADRHHALTGRWPIEQTGPVRDATAEVWKNIGQALRDGHRGLPGNSSLATLLEERRGKPNRRNRPRLTIAKILDWADKHRRRTGDWPMAKSGPVQGDPGESWQGIQSALTYGGRGLPGGDSLARLLARRCGRPLRPMRAGGRKKGASRAQAPTGSGRRRHKHEN